MLQNLDYLSYSTTLHISTISQFGQRVSLVSKILQFDNCNYGLN